MNWLKRKTKEKIKTKPQITIFFFDNLYLKQFIKNKIKNAKAPKRLIIEIFPNKLTKKEYKTGLFNWFLYKKQIKNNIKTPNVYGLDTTPK